MNPWISQIIRSYALKDPNYAPSCFHKELVRMVKVEPMLWRCETCGAVRDERDKKESSLNG